MALEAGMGPGLPGKVLVIDRSNPFGAQVGSSRWQGPAVAAGKGRGSRTVGRERHHRTQVAAGWGRRRREEDIDPCSS